MNRFLHIKKLICLLLLSSTLLCLCACGEDLKTGYRIVGDELRTDKLVLAFRDGDGLKDIVTAALSELAAGTDVAELSAAWLGSAKLGFSADAYAMQRFEEGVSVPEDRLFILGFDAAAAPRVIDENGSYTGFDIELARRMCDKLGWRLRLQPIKAENLKVELNSGNVDCAWGFPASAASGLSVTDAYLETDVVFVVKNDSDIKRKSNFSDERLYVASRPLRDAIEKSEDYAETFSRIVVVEGPAKALEALDKGFCTVILLDRLSLEYLA